MLEFSRRLTYSTTLPVDLSLTKQHLGYSVNYFAKDAYITDLIWKATDWLESTYGVAIVSQQWTQSASNLFGQRYNDYNYGPIMGAPFVYSLPYAMQGGLIRLEHYPVATLDSVSYYANGTPTSFATSNFILLNSDKYPGYVQSLPSSTVPVADYRPDAWKITYTAGYSTVPPGIARAIQVVCDEFNQNRGDSVTGLTVASVALGIERLMAPYVWKGAA